MTFTELAKQAKGCTITPVTSHYPQVCQTCYEDDSISVGVAIIDPGTEHFMVHLPDHDERICKECRDKLLK